MRKARRSSGNECKTSLSGGKHCLMKFNDYLESFENWFLDMEYHLSIEASTR